MARIYDTQGKPISAVELHAMAVAWHAANPPRDFQSVTYCSCGAVAGSEHKHGARIRVVPRRELSIPPARSTSYCANRDHKHCPGQNRHVSRCGCHCHSDATLRPVEAVAS